MKKLLMFAAIMVSLVGVKAYSEMYNVPEGNTIQPASIQYGGTKYSTGSFSVDYVTASVKPAVLQGIHLSSGVLGAGEFVDVWDATAVVNLSARTPLIRLYNVSGSTTVYGGNNNLSAGSVSLQYPIRFKKGLIFKSNTMYNSLILQYWAQED